MTFDWYPEERSYKRVTLCNVEEFQNLDEGHVRNYLLGMGASEWENYMEHLLTETISNAREHSKSTADVTKMFSCNLVGIDEFGEYRKEQEDVVAFLLKKLFDVVSETDEELKVVFKRN